VGLTTLETRKLKADMVEVYKILRGFELTDEVNISHRMVEFNRGHDLKLPKKKRATLDSKKFSLGIRVCVEWNKRPGLVVNTGECA